VMCMSRRREGGREVRTGADMEMKVQFESYSRLGEDLDTISFGATIASRRRHCKVVGIVGILVLAR
jgi:hypothetical protein